VEAAAAAHRGIRHTVVHLHQRPMMTIRDHHHLPCTRTRDRASEHRHIIVLRTVILPRGVTHLRRPLGLARWHRPRHKDTRRAEAESRIRVQIIEVGSRLGVAAVEGARFTA